MKTKTICLIFAIALSAATAQDSGTIDVAPSRDLEVDRSYWGWGVGGVFTHIPISKALDEGFAVLMANAYYGYLLSDPYSTFRVAPTLSVYGFQVVLPFPAAGVDFFAGQPAQDLQFKGSLGAFYDIAVGGHAGAYLGAGALIKNRFNVSFFIVPFGKDADKDYLDFVGQREPGEVKDCNESGVDCVIMPYFGIFAGFQY